MDTLTRSTECGQWSREVENDFRPIEGFPAYEVNRLGDVRNIKRGKFLNESETNGAFYYNLFNADTGKKASRNFWRLVTDAFPDMLR